MKRANPNALYVCDPVMGHPAKGCVVPPGVQTHHAQQSASNADVLCPNVLELGIMTNTEPQTPQEVLRAARDLLGAGSAKHVLVKHLAHAGLTPTDAFEMLLVSRDDAHAWHVSTPLLPFTKAPVGVGDLTSGLFLVGLLHGQTAKHALEHTASAYFEVMKATSAVDEYELQLVAAQDGLVKPNRWFDATALS